MAIPRLPPASSPTSVTLTVNENLSPYFIKFYQDTKLEGDTPETFLLRITKRLVVDHYVLNYVRDAISDQETANAIAIAAIKDDANLINVEVD